MRTSAAGANPSSQSVCGPSPSALCGGDTNSSRLDRHGSTMWLRANAYTACMDSPGRKVPCSNPRSGSSIRITTWPTRSIFRRSSSRRIFCVASTAPSPLASRARRACDANSRRRSSSLNSKNSSGNSIPSAALLLASSLLGALYTFKLRNSSDGGPPLTRTVSVLSTSPLATPVSRLPLDQSITTPRSLSRADVLLAGWETEPLPHWIGLGPAVVTALATLLLLPAAFPSALPAEFQSMVLTGAGCGAWLLGGFFAFQSITPVALSDWLGPFSV
mmetsp:Transcript_4977/g.12122  ORF Transcript_4977/g.12122 Transcript_4977/m.12122 type:complete len:275 (+) Transcript_4977:194-1018(+)